MYKPEEKYFQIYLYCSIFHNKSCALQRKNPSKIKGTVVIKTKHIGKYEQKHKLSYKHLHIINVQ